jgi:hypothetical protein
MSVFYAELLSSLGNDIFVVIPIFLNTPRLQIRILRFGYAVRGRHMDRKCTVCDNVVTNRSVVSAYTIRRILE